MNLEEKGLLLERMKLQSRMGFRTEFLSDYYMRLSEKEPKFNYLKDDYIKYLVEKEDELKLIKTVRYCACCDRNFSIVVEYKPKLQNGRKDIDVGDKYLWSYCPSCLSERLLSYHKTTIYKIGI